MPVGGLVQVRVNQPNLVKNEGQFQVKVPQSSRLKREDPHLVKGKELLAASDLNPRKKHLKSLDQGLDESQSPGLETGKDLDLETDEGPTLRAHRLEEEEASPLTENEQNLEIGKGPSLKIDEDLDLFLAADPRGGQPQEPGEDHPGSLVVLDPIQEPREEVGPDPEGRGPGVPAVKLMQNSPNCFTYDGVFSVLR